MKTLLPCIIHRRSYAKLLGINHVVRRGKGNVDFT
jgi:hypothetical protein